MLIHELVRRTGLSAHTIRFYEKSGLIRGSRNPEVKSNNYFHYDEETVERLAFISDAKSVGFTIREIGQMIDAWFNQKFTKKEKISLLDDKLRDLEQKLTEIRRMKKLIARFRDDIVHDLC